MFPFVIGRLGAVETTGVGLDVIGGLVLVVFIAIEFVTTGGFFDGTSKNIKQYYILRLNNNKKIKTESKSKYV